MGSPQATSFAFAVPVVPAAALATLISQAGTTGYSKCRLSGVFRNTKTLYVNVVKNLWLNHNLKRGKF